MKKRNMFLIIAIAFFALALIIGVLIIVTGSKKDEQAEIKKQIRPVVASFYEDDYYLSTNIDDIKALKENGITINLENLELMTGNEIDVDCNKELSTITIYPKEPFESRSYKIVYKLDCK